MFNILLNLIYLSCFVFSFNFIYSLDKSLNLMTLEEKIGQLFIVPACPLREGDHRADLQFLIENYHIGGILIKQGTTVSQLSLINQLKKISSTPLLCVQDAEWGTGMRLVDVITFPKNLTLGAVNNEGLLTQLGREIGKQCKLVGSHLNLAPVIDVNSNPANPIIHMRSFGEDSRAVALKGALVMQGIQSTGVMTCAKHFPGHGDTAVDSHVDLPIVLHDENRLKAIELFPFESLIQNNVDAVMSAHLTMPAFCENPSTPVTFSRYVITDVLQNFFEFKGLVITDALNMKALSRHYSPEEIAVRAFLAGHDLLLYGDHIAPNIDQILKEDVPRAFLAIKSAFFRGEITEEMIDRKVAKILNAKVQLGLFHHEAKNDKFSVLEEINSKEAFALKRALFEEAITVVRNEEAIPLQSSKMVLLEWGETPLFSSILKNAGITASYNLEELEWIDSIDKETTVILSLAGIKTTLPELGFNASIQECLMKLIESQCCVIAVLFGSPYSLEKVPVFEGMIVAYENEPESQETAAGILLGDLSPKGKLPITVLPDFPRGTGIHW